MQIEMPRLVNILKQLYGNSNTMLQNIRLFYYYLYNTKPEWSLHDLF